MESLKSWGQTRLMGRKKFIWVYGVLGWGLSVALPWSALMWYFESPRGSYLTWLVMALVAFPLGGAIVASWMWRRKERVHMTELERRPSDVQR